MCEHCEQTHVEETGYPHTITRTWCLKHLVRVADYLRDELNITYADLEEQGLEKAFDAVYCQSCEGFDHKLCGQCNACQNCCDGEHCSSCDVKTHDGLCESCGHCPECCSCAVCEHCDRRVETTCEHCNRCGNCCECVHCSRCNSVCNDDYCSDCERCRDCCNCSFCGNCGENVERTCGECGNCDDCCSCEKGPRARQSFRFKTPANRKGFLTNPLVRAVAIELELSSIADGSALESWAHETGSGLVEDGSIPDAGCEINTNPASGDAFLADMRTLASTLAEAEAETSEKCGLHVHVDARDYSQFDIRRAMLLWIAVEPTMFELVAKSRLENTYCNACGQTYVNILAREGSLDNWRQKLARGLYACEPRLAKNEKSDKYHSSRYNALNLHSFFFRKTLEFRIHEARIRQDILENFPLVCGWIVEKAFRMTEAQLLVLLRSEDSSEDILRSVLPASLREWVTKRLAERRKARVEAGTFEYFERNLRELRVARASFKSVELHRDSKPVPVAKQRKLALNQAPTVTLHTNSTNFFTYDLLNTEAR